MPLKAIISISKKKTKKYNVVLYEYNKKIASVDFGAKGYSDFTKHKDTARKQLYLSRHRTNENWTKSGKDTAGFWARWLLWNKPTLEASAKDIYKRFKIKVELLF